MTAEQQLQKVMSSGVWWRREATRSRARARAYYYRSEEVPAPQSLETAVFLTCSVGDGTRTIYVAPSRILAWGAGERVYDGPLTPKSLLAAFAVHGIYPGVQL
jgi:hypothetical protein